MLETENQFSISNGNETPDLTKVEIEEVYKQLEDTPRPEDKIQQLLFQASVLSHINDAVIAVDNDYRIIYWNKAAEQSYGFKTEEAIGLPLTQTHEYQWYGPEDEARAYADLNTVGYWRGENIHVKINGEKVWVDSTVSVLKDGSGRGTGLLAVIRDITQFKKEQAERANSENLLKQVLDSLPVGVWITDAQGQIVSWNTASEEIWGGAKAVGIKEFKEYKAWWADTNTPIEAEEWAVARAIRKGEISLNEIIHIEAFDGTRKTIINSAVPIRNPLGQTVGAVAVNQDISVLRQVEERLSFLSELGSLLASSLDYEVLLKELTRKMTPYLADYSLFDLVEENGTFRRAAIAHIDPVKEAVAEEIDYRFPPDPKGPHPLAQVLNSGQSVILPEMSDEVLEAQARNADHLRLLRALGPKSVMSVPLKIYNKVIGVLSLVSAESGRHYNEADLKMAEEIARRAAIAIENARLFRQTQKSLETQKELDYFKDLFISITSHELRSPLTSIRGYAQLLQRELLKQSKVGSEQEKPLRQVENIISQSNHMNNLIKQLLDFSRVQSGELGLETELSDLVQLVKHSVEQQQVTTDKHSLVIDSQAETIIIACDATRIEQVITNLVTNAIKYSPKGGTVTIGIEEEQYQAEIQEVVVWVRDEGIGISPEQQVHIFDRFYRVHNQETRKADGLGLGLYISYEIIKQHGGRMWVKSEKGRGSTFYFSLPVLAK